MQRKAILQSTNLHSCSERQSYKAPILNNAVKDIPPSQQPHYCNDGQPSITTLHLYQQRFSSTFPSSPITNSFVNSPFRLSGNENRPSTLHRADFYNQEDKTGVQGSVLLGYKTKSSFEALMIYCWKRNISPTCFEREKMWQWLISGKAHRAKKETPLHHQAITTLPPPHTRLKRKKQGATEAKEEWSQLCTELFVMHQIQLRTLWNDDLRTIQGIQCSRQRITLLESFLRKDLATIKIHPFAYSRLDG